MRAGLDRDVWAAEIPAGRTGEMFEYRLRRSEAVVAAGRGRAPARAGEPIAFAVIGDTGDGSENQRSVARALVASHRIRPLDFGLIAGDVAYECGRREEYAEKFFPVFGPMSGDSILSEVPFAAAAGNHDVGDLRWPLPPFRCRTDYSHFLFWRHPRGFPDPIPVNPRHQPKSPSSRLPESQDLRQMLADANYSFTWGDAHVTVLDSNRYVNWAAPGIRAWLERVLSAGQAFRWRFVLLHHPPFNQTSDHRGDQWTRFFAPLFEKYRVTLVFAGHVHNFQWFGPVRFAPDPAEIGRFALGSRGRLSGTFERDTGYDGVSRTAARWPIYVVSGAGGGSLVNIGGDCPADVRAPAGCGDPTPPGVSDGSITLVDVRPDVLVIRQVAARGTTLLERRVTHAATGPFDKIGR